LTNIKSPHDSGATNSPIIDFRQSHANILPFPLKNDKLLVKTFSCDPREREDIARFQRAARGPHDNLLSEGR
jgi:hypothetical protein